MRLRRSRGGRGSSGYHAVAYCPYHSLDLAALQRYADEGRPCSLGAALEAIAAGECPACRSRYLAGSPPVVTRQADAGLKCSCCKTSWYQEGGGWAAAVEDGLSVVDEIEPIPSGAWIDSGSFVVSPVDPVDGPEDVLRNELTGFAGKVDVALDEEVLEELVEGLAAAYAGKARDDAEIYRVLEESGLDEESADRWRAEALTTMHDVRRLFGAQPAP
jgi:hypothetical protein